ncbi:hypothetical protein HanXRQr2_Chr17g0809901 [Helianthus annuus]|uniref:Uncharacterized protein n=1 Tax=Helianthus annuus TaxID=4232 RepID=A0A9K3GVS1_HELAN|nr:hypothetical protein HanXRQr2_Chr17g0809901 [Helianthus annuus]
MGSWQQWVRGDGERWLWRWVRGDNRGGCSGGFVKISKIPLVKIGFLDRVRQCDQNDKK